MKPLWFYEALPMIMKHDVGIALRTFTAHLLDRVRVEVNIKRDFETYYDWDIAPQAIQRLAQEETHVNIIDIPVPGQKKAFIDQTYMVRPESIVMYAKDMNPDTGQLRPYILFQGFMKAIKYPTVHMKHSMYSENEVKYNIMDWEPTDDWFFINPVVMHVNSTAKENRRGII